MPNIIAGFFKAFRRVMPEEPGFFELFEQHADTIVRGSKTLSALLNGSETVVTSAQRIQNIEHEADGITRRVLLDVRRCFVTPFDRSSISDLISSMDDAVDEMLKTAKSITLYRVADFTVDMKAMATIIETASALLKDAIPLLKNVGKNAAALDEITGKIVALEGEADFVHETGLSHLFDSHQDDFMGFVVNREIFSHLERVMDRLEDVANDISGIVIDHA